MPWYTVSKALQESKSITSPASPHSAKPVILSEKLMSLVWCDLLLTNLFVSFQFIMLGRIKNWLLIICSSIFPGINAMLPCLQTHRFFFSTFKSCSLISLSSGLWELTLLHEFLKTITNGLEIALASFLSTPRWVSSGPADLNSSDLFKYPAVSQVLPVLLSCSN